MISFIVLALLAQNSPGAASDVFTQAEAHNALVRTLSFDFRISDKTSARMNRDKQPKTEIWNGTLWFREPLEFKIQYTKEEHSEQHAFIAGLETSRQLTLDKKTGVTRGAVDRGGPSAIAEVHGLASLLMRTQFEWWKKHIPFEKWEAKWDGKLIHMTGPSWGRDAPPLEWKIDPDRGFSIVSILEKSRFGEVIINRTTSYTVREINDGLWLNVSAKSLQTIDGKIQREVDAEIVIETLKVNQPISADVFEVKFPSGTVVSDLNQKTIHTEGGKLSRTNQDVAQLAEEAEKYRHLAPAGPTNNLIPNKGALAVADNEYGVLQIGIAVSTLAAVAGLVFTFLRHRT